MDKLLKQLQQGDITANTFFKETDEQWRKLALDRYKKIGHRLQGNADVDDVFQEMVMSVAQSVEDYDSTRTDMTLKGYVIWVAYVAAKDFVNQQCGAYKGRSSEPVRCPLAATYLDTRSDIYSGSHQHADGHSTVEFLLNRLSSTDADQEWATDVRAIRTQVVETMIDHVVMNSLVEVGGSLQDIADYIYKNDKLCAQLGLSTPNKTYGMVRRTTNRFAERAACMSC